MEKAHKKLKVWKEAMELTKTVYMATARLPENEKYGLLQQMRRAATSVPCNIAEGAARQGNRDSVQFYIVARGSLSELDTQTQICQDLHLLTSDDIERLLSGIDTADCLLSGIIRYKRKAFSSHV